MNKTKKSNASLPELAELLGDLSGDVFIGNYGKRKHQSVVQFTSHSVTDRHYFNYLEKIMMKIDSSAHISYMVRNQTLRMNTYSKTLFSFMITEFNFPIGKKGGRVEIPEWILSDHKLIASFIRGLFDTDVCLFFDKRASYKSPYPRLVLEITSHNLFKHAEWYLQKHFKLTAKERVRHGRFKIYVLEIYGHNQLKKWLEIIGFSNQKHLSKLPL